MATAGDRLQIVLAAKDEISAELRKTKRELTAMGRTATDMSKRMEAGEQGLQDEYEQTRREMEKNRLKQIELGRAASKAKSEIRQMTTDSTDGMKRLDRATDGVNRSMDKTQTFTSSLTTGWGKMVGAVAIATGAIASLSGAFRFLSSSIEEARGARKAMAQTEAVMRSMGRTEAPEAIGRMIDRLSELSGVDDDLLRELTNVMFTFGNVTGDTFERATALALDLSVAFNKDLQSSAVMVGKAINDPIKGLTALSRIGVQFTDKQQDQIEAMMAVNDLAGAQKIIMGELARQVGGSAAAQADSIDKTTVAWGNFKEAVGEALLSSSPGWDLVGGIKSATKWIKQNKGEIIETLLTIAGSAARVGQAFLKMGAVVTFAWGQILLQMVPVLKILGYLIPGMDGMATSLTDTALSAITASDKMWESADAMGRMADSTFAARDEVKQLNDQLATIKSKKVRLEVRTTISDALQAVIDAMELADDLANRQGQKNNNFDARAMGGPVNVGVPTLVGELGPELFVPTIGPTRVIGADGPEIRDFRTSGTVIPNHLLATVTLPKQQSATPAGYIGPPVQIGTINTSSGVDVEAAVLRATMRADRIARERR